MSTTLQIILNELDALAAYDGPWQALREEGETLRLRTAELREREAHLQDVLMVALVGGSGVGKSTLLNALAGDQIAETSEMRPCTNLPVVYHPPGVQFEFNEWTCVSRSALDHLVLIDTPDSDTIVHQHRALTEDVLTHCDLILLCGSPEKYLDEATWSMLLPLQGQRGLVCVETKAAGEASIETHWRDRLEEAGFTVTAYFRVNALHALDQKLAGKIVDDTTVDFPKLEAFLRHELNRERIARIKQANVSGLLTKTIADLARHAHETAPQLETLHEAVSAADNTLAQEAFAVARERLFAAPHLWVFAMGREMSLRSKGLLGMLFRIFEALRSLPARLPALLPWGNARATTGRQATALLKDNLDEEDVVALRSESLSQHFDHQQSTLALSFTQAGLIPPESDTGRDAFQTRLNDRLAQVLRGPARDRVLHGAGLLTSWPASLLGDAPLLAFIGYAGWRIVREYFSADLLPLDFFLHTGSVLLILIGIEVALLSLAARALAFLARRRSQRDLRTAFYAPGLAFQQEQTILDQMNKDLQCIHQLEQQVQSNSES